MFSELSAHLMDIFGDNSLFGFSRIDKSLAEREGCKCAIVTLLPYPDLEYCYEQENIVSCLAIYGKNIPQK